MKDGPVRFSDDGEPGGTAGMPTLQVLQRERLFNVTCVVTRYFGGILLGGRRSGFRAPCQGCQDCGGCCRQVHEAGLDGPLPAGALQLVRADEAGGGCL
ncbi:MAG: YigZ family protein [Oscillospiraceae bacterium]